MKKWFKIAIWVLGIFMLLMLILSLFKWPAEKVAAIVKKPVGSIVQFAVSALLVGIGLFLISSGVAALPAGGVIGAILIVVGIGVVVWGLWPLFSGGSSNSTELPNMGTK